MALITGTNHPCWWPLIFALLLLVVASSGVGGSSDAELLLKFKESLQNINNNNNNIALLSSWNASTPPCSGSHWKGVLCYNGHIWGLKLENMRLKGVIDVDSLKALPYLRTVSFMNNDFDTTWPELNKLVGLKNIYLSNNKFYGEIPAQTFQGMQWLKKIHLSNNQFTGAIPTSLASLPRLMELRLEGNKFSGHIPRFHRELAQGTLAKHNFFVRRWKRLTFSNQ